MSFRSVCQLALGVMCALRLSAEPKWIRIESEGFEVFSSEGERATRDLAKHFEQVRAFFVKAIGADKQPERAVRIIVFRSKDDFDKYTGVEFAAAFYRGSSERDLIVMSDASSESYDVAAHEYVHVLVNHAGIKLPVWLNEGLADLYSTMKPAGEKILIGTPPRGRVSTAMTERWLPIDTVCSATVDSPLYNEKARIGSLYSESWALTHMLALDNEFRPKFTQFLGEIRNGATTAAAMQKVYGRTMAEIDKLVQQYVRQSTINAALFPSPGKKDAATSAAQPLGDYDREMTLAEVLSGKDADKKRSEQIEAVAAKYSSRPESLRAVAYLRMKDGKVLEGERMLQKAFDAGDRDPGLLFAVGRAESGVSQATSLQALDLLIAAQPERVDARLLYSHRLLKAGRRAEAREALRPVKKVTPKDAIPFFRQMAYCALAVQDMAEARASATRWLSIAQDHEKGEAQRFLDALNSSPTASGVVETLGAVAGGVNLRERITGTFSELLCTGQNPSMVIETDKGRLILLIDKPDSVTLTGAAGVSTELNCGKQPGKRVKVEFDPPGRGQEGISGLVRAVDFGG